MFIFLIIFFIVFCISYVFIIYKVMLLDDDIEILYDNYSKYVEDSFKRGDKKNVWYVYASY